MFRIFSFGIIICFCTETFGQKSDVLRIKFEIQDTSFVTYWSFNDERLQFRIGNNAFQMLKQLNYLRNSLILKRTPDKSILKNLSESLIEPLKEQLATSEIVNFIINDTLLTYPFDLLLFNDKPLFLQFEIFYSFDYVKLDIWNLNENAKGLIVRDSTADPENGCGIVKDLYSSSNYYDISNLNLNDFENFGKYDFMLISAHGVIADKDIGYIDINGKELLPKHLAQINPNLIYFDACNLGISKSFISTFENIGTKYLLAPIMKNEAGNSSALTIKYFFENLKNEIEPIEALFQARIKVYNRFNDGNNQKNLLWYSFPFRIYALN